MKGNQSEPNPQLHVHSSSHFVFPFGRCFCLQDSERPEIEAEPSDRELGNMHVTLTRTLVELPGSEIR
ncbi:hypothetical protein EXN66_Car019751 [Channa argus]|uniref:Uncharacterized protein n=1 Tax=Channa argus TaxID=215402 RepID=A0A6G1QP43_CHAAH|nr:hypothetical protein EXN66_Car019751 [Channa argus]